MLVRGVSDLYPEPAFLIFGSQTGMYSVTVLKVLVSAVSVRNDTSGQ
jgi:hypothetical protein